MVKKKGILILLPALLIVLELLPYGAVLNFVIEGGETVGKTYSYFSLMPFGNANFAPFIIAVLSCVLLCLTILYAIKNKALGAIRVISLIIVVLSFCPIILSLSYLSVIGIAVAVVAFAEAVLSYAIGKSVK